MNNLYRFALRFSIPLVVWLFVYWDSLGNMIGVWAQSKTYEHCYLILPISLWLIWQKKESIKVTPLGTAFLPALLLLFPCLLWIIGHAASIAFFEHIAAVTSLQLIIWALIGNKLAALLAFPLFYLSFNIPFGEELIPYLQEVTAHLSVQMIRLSGIPVYREGLYLTIPNGQFEVAEACSGIRFLISSIALGTLFAHFFFTNKWKFSLYVLFSCLFPILANSIRAYGIIMIGYLSDMKYATGADHLIYGWVFFSIVIILMFFAAWLMQDKLEYIQPPQMPPTKQGEKWHDVFRVSLPILIIFSAVIIWRHSTSGETYQITNPITLPEQLKETPRPDWDITFPQADQVILASSPDNSADFFSARYYSGQNKGELISSSNSLYNKEKWTLNKKTTLKINNSEASEISLVSNEGDSRTVIYWYCINDYCSSNPLKIKLIKAYYLLLKRNITSDVIAISSTHLSSLKLQEKFLKYALHNQHREETPHVE